MIEGVALAGLVPRIERRPERAAPRFLAEPSRLVIVDARGALAQGLVAARAIGEVVEARRGAMLVLLSARDAPAARAAFDAGATNILVSPFGSQGLADALQLAVRHTARLADAAAGKLIVLDDGPAHDELTGLATGDQLQRWAELLLGVPGRPQPVFVLAVGAARFAQINAAYGRSVADRVLRVVAARLTAIVNGRQAGQSPGEARLLARLAAAEFAVGIAGPVTLTDANRLAAALAEAFARPFEIDEHVIHLTARIGIAAADGDSEAAALLRRASAALASARAGESGTVEVFRRAPAGDPLTRMADLEADLHRAIGDGGIALRFQPQLDLATGRITGVEALARWAHPVLGLLPAETLLETAQSAELAVQLGRQIRAQALAAAAAWTGGLAALHLSLNVTADDLADPAFTWTLDTALAETGLDRKRLTLEVTEGALIDDIPGVMMLLDTLRATGISISLDDFGTGYSSLAWLARLPIDAVKLDKAFTEGLLASDRQRSVVEAVVALSKRLGIQVVAEGVETEDQLAAVRASGCDSVQGFKVAAALDENELSDFCRDWIV